MSLVGSDGGVIGVAVVGVGHNEQPRVGLVTGGQSGSVLVVVHHLSHSWFVAASHGMSVEGKELDEVVEGREVEDVGGGVSDGGGNQRNALGEEGVISEVLDFLSHVDKVGAVTAGGDWRSVLRVLNRGSSGGGGGGRGGGDHATRIRRQCRVRRRRRLSHEPGNATPTRSRNGSRSSSVRKRKTLVASATKTARRGPSTPPRTGDNTPEL